jgi:adenylate cyclase class 2
MHRTTVEIKARCAHPEEIKELLDKQQAEFKGVDKQTDTYFKVDKGRLKLREGNIENALIHYHRPDETGPKRSDVTLFQTGINSGLKEILHEALHELVVVKKNRSIYFIDNVKFHVDEVEHLGSFIEIEVIDEVGDIGEDSLRTQCQYYLNLFKIKAEDLVDVSYSDMLLNNKMDL